MKYPGFLILLFFSFFTTTLKSQSHKAPGPHWVKPVELRPDNESDAHFVLLEKQVNFIEKSRYYRNVIRLSGPDMVAEYADVSFSYDPSYQSGNFHEVGVIRDGKYIDKLASHVVNAFQRESNMERHLYDGSITAIINLADIRVGDILVYSFSLNGFNPAFENHEFSRMIMGFMNPVDRVYYRVIAEEGSKLKYHLYHGVQEPKVSISNGHQEFVWDQNSSLKFKGSNHTPYTEYKQPIVVLSNFESWRDVVQSIYPQYTFSEYELSQLKIWADGISKSTDMESRIAELIRFVQDEVRYLGFEDGLSAYVPHSPLDVYKQRFGDCKDKSHLLTGLLRSIGVEANSMLVSVEERGALNNKSISPYLFDHCVVELFYDSQKIYVDPTWNNQGGSLMNLAFPDYEKGLVIRAGNNALTTIENKNSRSTRIIDEYFIPQPNEGKAKVLVKTSYEGEAADEMRSFFENNTATAVQELYANYYSSVFPSIKAVNDVHHRDTRNLNLFTVEEEYEIDSIWYEEEGMYYLDIPSIQISDVTYIEVESERSVGYYQTYPLNLSHLLVVHLPEEIDWELNSELINVKSPYYEYQLKVDFDRSEKVLRVKHDYKTKERVIPADQYSKFISDHSEIRDNWAYVLQVPANSEAGSSNLVVTSKYGFLSIFLMVGSIIGTIFLCLRINDKYDPKPEYQQGKGRKIGSWLILVAIGLAVSPFINFFSIVSEPGYFNGDAIELLFTKGNPFYSPFTAILLFTEVIIQSALTVFSVYVAILFFKRRSSAPQLIIILFVSYAAWSLVDLSLLALIDQTMIVKEDIKDTVRAVSQATLWGLVFHFSSRVKETFVLQKNPETSTTAPTVEIDGNTV